MLMPETLTVGDLVSLQRGTTYDGQLVGLSGPPLLGLGSIEPGGGFRHDHFKTFGGNCPPKVLVEPGQIFVALKGATKDGSMVGSVARMPQNLDAGRLTQDTARLDFVDPDPLLARHVYWALRTPRYRAYCAERVTGTGAAALSRSDFLSFVLPAITDDLVSTAALLDTLDSEIEISRQMNDTIQQLITTLYQSITIDRSGWGTTSIGEAVTVRGGATPPTGDRQYWVDGGHSWATPRDLSRLSTPVLLDTERHITDAGVTRISSGLLPPGTLLLSSRAPIGYLAIAEVPTAINQGFIAMICDRSLPNHYVWQWTLANLDAIKARANGTTFQEISKGNFRPMRIPVPPQNLLDAFTAKASRLYRLLVNNVRLMGTLVEVRETLLRDRFGAPRRAVERSSP